MASRALIDHIFARSQYHSAATFMRSNLRARIFAILRWRDDLRQRLYPLRPYALF